MSKLTFWQTIDLSRKSIIIQSSPEDFLALGKAFPFITSLWCLLRNLISIILWKHCGQILLICRNKIQNGKRRKGKEGGRHSWRWSCPWRPFLWGEAQVILAFVHKHKLILVKWRARRLSLSCFQPCCFRFVSVIAKPMASKKLAKKVYKVRFTLAHHRFYPNIGHV